MDVMEGTNLSRAKYFFFPSLPLEIRWDSTRGRTGSRIYPSRGMIYHRDVPLKSFLPEKLFLAKQGSTAPFPPLLAPCRCNLVFGANVSAEMNPEWIMDTGARLMEGSVSNPWTSILSRDVCRYWNFYSYEFFAQFFFLFSILFFSRNSGLNLMMTVVVARHVACANIYRVRGLFFFWKFRVNIFKYRDIC